MEHPTVTKINRTGYAKTLKVAFKCYQCDTEIYEGDTFCYFDHLDFCEQSCVHEYVNNFIEVFQAKI